MLRIAEGRIGIGIGIADECSWRLSATNAKLPIKIAGVAGIMEINRRLPNRISIEFGFAPNYTKQLVFNKKLQFIIYLYL